MHDPQFNRRRFIKETVTTAAGIVVLSAFPENLKAAAISDNPEKVSNAPFNISHKSVAPRIKFSVIGLNHGHINSQVEAVIRGGGQLISFYAKEADLAAAFAKRYPQAKLVKSEKEILEDKSILLVLSAAIQNERAPLGVRVMRSGKDYMVDKPG